MTLLDKNELGIAQVIFEHLGKYHLPRALALKDRVDTGELLDILDMAFLESVFSDAHALETLTGRHPEYLSVTAKVVGLYHHITEYGLANERHTR